VVKKSLISLAHQNNHHVVFYLRTVLHWNGSPPRKIHCLRAQIVPQRTHEPTFVQFASGLVCNRHAPNFPVLNRAPARLTAHLKTPIWEGLCLKLHMGQTSPHQRAHHSGTGVCILYDRHNRGCGVNRSQPLSRRQMGHIRTGQL
jgi:hypothetical protein